MALLQRIGVLLVWATWVALPGPAWAAQDPGSASYLNPAGWTDQYQAGVHSLVAPAARQGEFLAIMIFAPRQASSDPAADLVAFADQAEQQGRRLERGAVERSNNGNYTVLVMPGRVDMQGMGPHWRIYQLVTDGQRSVFATTIYRGEATFAANQGTLRQVLKSVRPVATTLPQQAPPTQATQAAKSASGIPYGASKAMVWDKNFIPSGKGVPIPPAELNNGAPLGLWWNIHISQNITGSTSWNSPFVRAAGDASIYSTVFLADGTVVRFFRPGGPHLADIEGMRTLGDSPYIGNYSVSGGVMTATYGEHKVSKPIKLGGSSSEPYFVWNAEEYHPAIPLTRQYLVGAWQWGGGNSSLTFQADGTVIATPAAIDAQWTHQNLNERLVGTWALDGYLLALQFPVDGSRVYVAFRGNNGGLVINQSLLTRN